MSRRRTGAIGIGVGAATAVVLSLAGAKTPVIIGSAAALVIACGVVAARKGSGKSADKYLGSGDLKLDNKDFHGAIADFNKALFESIIPRRLASIPIIRLWGIAFH